MLGATAERCDVLVNNAGIGHVGTLLTTKPQDLDRLYAVNVKGVLHMTRALLPAMAARQFGSVINLASIGGIVAVRDRFAYTATKFAVVGMTKAAALDHADTKVRFNCICPGRVETPFVQARLKEYPDPRKAYEEMASTQALKRMGRPGGDRGGGALPGGGRVAVRHGQLADHRRRVKRGEVNFVRLIAEIKKARTVASPGLFLIK